MSFSASWLDLREPYDHGARAPVPRRAFCDWLDQHPQTVIADLGGGTGSTARALAPDCRLKPNWLIIENDRCLIEEGQNRDARLEYIRADLTSGLTTIIPEIAGAITCSALIDLVSALWLRELVTLAVQRRLPLYVALSYDGGMRWRPGDLFDRRIKTLFNAHQQRDKGFGPALGPGAATELLCLLAGAGGKIIQGRSDWVFTPQDQAIQIELLDGYRQASHEMDPAQTGEIGGWHAARLSRIERGQSRHMVGHTDILWLPDSR